MTIALGLIGTDGIVIAADTEETYGEFKNETTKILTGFQSAADGTLDVSGGACVITNAGDSGYVTAIAEKLAYTFLSNTERVEEEFADCLATTYAKHVTPFLSLPKEHWPEIEMLWAYSRNGICRLFFNDKSMPVPVQRYRAVGIGGSFAEHFLNKFWKLVDTKTLEILAAYTVFAAKRAVPFCGKSTQIVTLHQSHPADLIFRMPSKVVARWEDEFRSKWVSAEQDTVWKLLTQSASREGQP